MMEQYTTEQRSRIIQFYYQNQESIILTQRAYQRYFNVRSAPHRTTINRLVANFHQQGAVRNLPGSGRRRTAYTDDNIQRVLESVRDNPETSTRKRSTQLGLSRRSLQRILATLSSTQLGLSRRMGSDIEKKRGRSSVTTKSKKKEKVTKETQSETEKSLEKDEPEKEEEIEKDAREVQETRKRGRPITRTKEERAATAAKKRDSTVPAKRGRGRPRRKPTKSRPRPKTPIPGRGRGRPPTLKKDETEDENEETEEQ